MSNSITAPITIIQNTINAPITLGIIGGGGGDLTSGPVRATNGVSSIANGALSIAMTSGLQTALDAKQATLTNYSTISALTEYPSSFTPSSHTHVSADVTDASLGGNGAADAGKLLKFGASGDIKADSVTAYSEASEGGCALFPTEIALFNGATSTLLSTLATDLRSVVFKDASGTVAFISDIPDISTKQDTLVSGTNIKTVASQSLLGSTNIPALLTDPTGITGAAALSNIVSLTQAQYDAIGSKSSTTLYIIT